MLATVVLAALCAQNPTEIEPPPAPAPQPADSTAQLEHRLDKLEAEIVRTKKAVKAAKAESKRLAREVRGPPAAHRHSVAGANIGTLQLGIVLTSMGAGLLINSAGGLISGVVLVTYATSLPTVQSQTPPLFGGLAAMGGAVLTGLAGGGLLFFGANRLEEGIDELEAR